MRDISDEDLILIEMLKLKGYEVVEAKRLDKLEKVAKAAQRCVELANKRMSQLDDDEFLELEGYRQAVGDFAAMYLGALDEIERLRKHVCDKCGGSHRPHA